MIRALFAVLTLSAGLVHADYCHEYSIEELKAMTPADLRAERDQVTKKLIDALFDEDAEVSRADQLGCEAQGRVLDRLIMAHREDAERAAKAR